MIRVEEVKKTFERIHALDAVSMQIEKGSICGLVGRNGSGKTTILKHLAGIYHADAGEITLDGEPVFENAAAKQKLCLIPDDPYFFSKDTLSSLGKLYGGLYPSWNPEYFTVLTERFQLDKNAKISTFSRGMQKQASFCLAMAANPEYLFLDEPLDGLDPVVRKLFWDILLDAVSERDLAVITSSHNLRELEDYCDTVDILDSGRMILSMDIDELKDASCKVQVSYAERPLSPYIGLDVLQIQSNGNTDLLIVRNTPEQVEELLKKYSPVILNITSLTLEEIFIY